MTITEPDEIGDGARGVDIEDVTAVATIAGLEDVRDLTGDGEIADVKFAALTVEPGGKGG